MVRLVFVQNRSTGWNPLQCTASFGGRRFDLTHSDDSQIATRMNWEAAKMVRAGMDPEDALALVTINTAKILGIDHRTGSLEEGKDGDFVIWSGNPLSITTKAEQTWIEGQKFFDLREDRTLQQRIQKERSELINWILEEGYE